MNKIILNGRLTRDPNLKVSDTGSEFCNFSIAVNRRFKDKNGEYGVDFFDCTAFGKSGVFVNQYFHKGDGITVEGRMESRKYVDRDGNNRTAWSVTCDNVEFPAGGKKQGGEADAQSGAPTYTPASGAVGVEVDDGDGEIPF